MRQLCDSGVQTLDTFTADSERKMRGSTGVNDKDHSMTSLGNINYFRAALLQKIPLTSYYTKNTALPNKGRLHNDGRSMAYRYQRGNSKSLA